LNNNSWFQFAWVSNELVTPKILACPSDRLVRVADDFSLGTNGFLNVSYQNRAVSYTLSHPFPEDGRLVLSSDRSMNLGGGLGSGCGGYFGAPIASGSVTSNMLWMDFMHVRSGSLLFNDGSVEQTDNDGLRSAIGRYQQLPPQNDRPSAVHFLFPRPPGLISETEN
jgi:hypothetical protein